VIGALLMQRAGADGTLTVLLAAAVLDVFLVITLFIWVWPLSIKSKTDIRNKG
jgi:hypothetical protein